MESVGIRSVWPDRGGEVHACADFDPDIEAVESQPFRLSWMGGSGRRSHVPDFFARGDALDGSGLDIDGESGVAGNDTYGSWPTIGEIADEAVVGQTKAMSCVQACAEMVSGGGLLQADLIVVKPVPWNLAALTRALQELQPDAGWHRFVASRLVWRRCREEWHTR